MQTTTELGRTGEQVSKLSLGAMLMGTRTDEQTSFGMLDRYLDTGGSFVDTADCYAWWPAAGNTGGESETVLGRWFAARGNRDRVFFSTKGSAWVDEPDRYRGKPARPKYAGAAADTLRAALDGSLRRLGTDHIDLYYVHVDDTATPLEETLDALAGFVKAGKIRHIGWSNVRTWRLERILGLCDRHGWPAPVALQQQHSYLRPTAGANSLSIVDDEQLDHLRANPRISLVAYSPILKGIYDDPAKRDGHPSMVDYAGPDADARLARLTALAADLAVTPNQLVLAWLLHQTDPTPITLVGPRTPEQLDTALGALDIKLSDEHLTLLDG
ncbi:aldo/keto reductase [Actinophytocola algeriensis]|uniref:Aryl-alcohol dehydrogenase-like predicted oxidoreductase n=1 Tax=Actinophytocola algeriensis TaxID=1768010 RepID=A0A7W7PZT4_9PSEU|nr:aldo/keto reductase [Actinophytocola algeriensis]MBB4904344.1 aryl-alcohol dehydrogenase-like predicted oxidoreductase [Actinophytocola algeriensis]MBE1476798.1 aryl-alcohol dehydrogenase-like predicted oxidoreductase [Actinophytocola algeriensis]